MAYLHIKNFELGMDRRKSRLSGVPGSLWTLKNAFVTRGGEIQRAKKFVSTYALPPAQTHGMASVRGALYVFGSVAGPVVPSGVNYQRLQHPDGGTAMTRVLDVDTFDGKLYVVAEYADDSIFHFYDGEIIADWIAGEVRAFDMTLTAFATRLAAAVDESDSYSAVAASQVITITGAGDNDDSAWAIAATAVDGGVIDDQTAAVATTQQAVAAVDEVVATGSFSITGGTASAGVNMITSVKVNTVEVLSVSVDWAGSHALTAAAVAAQITSFTSAPNYSATADGATVTISAAVGSGASPNGFPIAVTVAGDVTTGNFVNMQGGVLAVTGQPQISTVTLGGTYDPGDLFTILLGDGVTQETYGYDGSPTPIADVILTFKSKVYAAGSSLVNFSGVNRPDLWNRDNPAAVGAGFINAANQDGGSDEVTGLEIYQGSMAIFAEDAIQIWSMSDDPAANTLLQSLRNTGTKSPRSTRSFGSMDVFYLASSGIRTLRARDNTNTAYASDIGTPIDTVVQAYIKTLTDDQIERAVSVIEPLDERYWLALGERVYAFSYFPTSKISAWSYLEPGFEISDFARVGDKLYVRADDTIYLYGGEDGVTFPAANEMAPVVETSFFDAGRAAHKKSWGHYDQGALGTWDVYELIDPNNELRMVAVGSITDTIYHTTDVTKRVQTSHIALKLTCTSAGDAALYSVALHHDMQEAK
jgi:hypothetical protein